MQNIMGEPGQEVQARKVYYVLGKSSIPYADRCIASLVRNTTETLEVMILSDSPEDAGLVKSAIAQHFTGTRHTLRVVDEIEARERAADYYVDFPAIRQFREGHPCWRKITDPQMYARPEEEVIILDPDVYFPNPFAFEPAPRLGIALMYQVPNCLLPEQVVRRAFDLDITMIDHTDIGVCQYQGVLNLAYLEELINRLSVEPLPRSMHIESIVWAALAAQSGGGLLMPEAWHCYRNSVAGRIARRLGRSGVDCLRRIDFRQVKAFHAGGEAKHWLVAAEQAGVLSPMQSNTESTPKIGFKAYSRGKFERKFFLRRLAGKSGLAALWR